MISIICVFNKKDILDEYLLKSLSRQSVQYELILLDNTNRSFHSAAQALNSGGREAHGDYLMFVHQDVRLGSENWLDVVEKRLGLLTNLGAAGVVGMHETKGIIITNMKQGDPPAFAGPMQINYPMRAQTLDECLMLVPASVFQEIEFDEDTCDDWHLYAVDYCLSVKELGYDVYVLPDEAYHRSRGYSMSGSYYRIIEKVMRKHRVSYPIIYTTMGNWVTSRSVIVNRLARFKRKLIVFCRYWGGRLLHIHAAG